MKAWLLLTPALLCLACTTPEPGPTVAPPGPGDADYDQGITWAKKAATAPELPADSDQPLKDEEKKALEFFEKAVAAKADHAKAHLGIADLLAPHAIAQYEKEAAAAKSKSKPKARVPSPSPTPAAPGPDLSVDRVTREYLAADHADPSTPAALNGLVEFSLRTERLEDAEKALLELTKRGKRDAQPYVRYGDFLVKSKKDLAAAIAQYDTAIAWNPDDQETRGKLVDVYLELAKGHMAKKEFAWAESRLKEAEKCAPDPKSPQGIELKKQIARLEGIRGRPIS